MTSRAAATPGSAVARETFCRVHGTTPAGVWAAPGRVNLIGEHTDYNDGFVLPFALPAATYVAAAPQSGPRWTVHSTQTGETVAFTVDDLTPGGVTGWAGYVAGTVYAMRAAGYAPDGATLAVHSDVPGGAGLSSSAALTCATLSALAGIGGPAGAPMPETAERPRLAHRAEAEFVGVPCGIMDQAASVWCRDRHALFLDCRSGDAEHVPFDPPAFGLAVLVLDTRAPHRLADGAYADRRRACAEAAAALGVASMRDVPRDGLADALARLDDPVARRRVRHVVTEHQRVRDTVDLLRAGAVGSTGPLLSASHASLRDDFEVTVPELDVAAQAAEEAGAHGARMTGGGFGGCVIALVDADAADTVAGAVADAFAARGFPAPRWFTAAPAAGATRVD